MRPVTDRIADAAPDPRDPETPPAPRRVETVGHDERPGEDDDDFAGPFAAW